MSGEGERLTFDAQWGSVAFVSNGYPTMDQVSKLAEAAQLLGIPGGAKLTSLRMMGRGEQVEVEISWRVEP